MYLTIYSSVGSGISGITKPSFESLKCHSGPSRLEAADHSVITDMGHRDSAGLTSPAVGALGAY